MVRGRRTRRAAAATTTQVLATTAATNGSMSPIASNGTSPIKPSSSPLAQQNGMQVMAKGNVVLVEDYCCASPKRKEYKIDELLIKSNGCGGGGGYTLGGSGEGCTTELITTTSPTKTRMVLRGTQNIVVTNGGVPGVNGTGSVTNGRLCPVAGNEITRFLLSQAKSKSRKARKKSPNIELVNDDTCDSFTNATTLQEQAANTHLANGTGVNGVVKMEADDEESEDNVITGEGAESSPHPFQMFGRMPIGEEMTDGENIFLQEPVLKLTVDEAACVLVQPKSEQAEKNKSSSSVTAALINQDSNSGDSGVVIDKLSEASQVTPKPLLAVSRQRVPTTPHRILCPSSPQLNGNGAGAGGEEGTVADVKEEGMTVEEGSHEVVDEEEENGGEDVQMTKRKLVLPTKEDEEDPESVASETQHQNIKQESQLHDQKLKSGGIKQEGETMKAPKTNGVSLKGSATTTGNHQSTMEDFFKVRRSVRKTKKEVEREEQLAIEKAILRASDMGLAVKMFENKGRGIVATRAFAKGEFVVEYVGEFISIAEANKREKVYAEDQSTGCYMYYFKHKNKQYCIDATEETGKLGRLVNHSRNGNLMTRTVEVRGQPHLVLIAKEDIEEGRELNYDYGDRSKESLLHHPWLAY